MRLAASDGETVEHAVVRTTAGAEERVRARCFALAGGALETPRLLLQSSSSRHPEGLGNDRDLVGRFFVEHPTYLWRSTSGRPDGLHEGTYRTYTLNDRFRREGLNACHFQIHVGRSGQMVWKAQPEMQPRPENRVSLSRSGRDRFGSPLSDVRFGFSERDNRTTDKALGILEQQARRLGAEVPIRPEKIWRAHPAGTCRMGFDETGGVVDRDGKVFGVDNLFVSGSTVFPTAGTSNPTLTIVAMTLRLADHILSRFGQ
jgi:choline dehydrogenase-like flavoprotein